MIVNISRESLRYRAIEAIRRACYVILFGLIVFRFWIAYNKDTIPAGYSLKSNTNTNTGGSLQLVKQTHP